MNSIRLGRCEWYISVPNTDLMKLALFQESFGTF